MKLIESKKDHKELEDSVYLKVDGFRYLEVNLSTRNDWLEEIDI